MLLYNICFNEDSARINIFLSMLIHGGIPRAKGGEPAKVESKFNVASSRLNVKTLIGRKMSNQSKFESGNRIHLSPPV